MDSFLQGMAAMGCLVPALFFLRFWRLTRDRLFLIFSIAFGLMFATRLLMAALGAGHLHDGYVYMLRFAAYLLIVAAIIDKNRPR